MEKKGDSKLGNRHFQVVQIMSVFTGALRCSMDGYTYRHLGSLGCTGNTPSWICLEKETNT